MRLRGQPDATPGAAGEASSPPDQSDQRPVDPACSGYPRKRTRAAGTLRCLPAPSGRAQARPRARTLSCLPDCARVRRLGQQCHDACTCVLWSIWICRPACALWGWPNLRDLHWTAGLAAARLRSWINAAWQRVLRLWNWTNWMADLERWRQRAFSGTNDHGPWPRRLRIADASGDDADRTASDRVQERPGSAMGGCGLA